MQSQNPVVISHGPAPLGAVAWALLASRLPSLRIEISLFLFAFYTEVEAAARPGSSGNRHIIALWCVRAIMPPGLICETAGGAIETLISSTDVREFADGTISAEISRLYAIPGLRVDIWYVISDIRILAHGAQRRCWQRRWARGGKVRRRWRRQGRRLKRRQKSWA